MKNKFTAGICIIVLVIAPFLVFATSNSEPQHTTLPLYNSISSEEAKRMLDEDDNVILLDVRTEAEHSVEKIPGSIVIPINELEMRILDKFSDKSTQIIIYCQGGVRSKAAVELLIDLGYTNIYDLGGIVDWKYSTE